MNCATARTLCLPSLGGVQIICADRAQISQAEDAFSKLVQSLDLLSYVHTERIRTTEAWVLKCALQQDIRQSWLPDHDSTKLFETLGHNRQSSLDRDVDREVLVSLLAAPLAFAFSDVASLASAVRVRRYIVTDSRKTALAFKTQAAERPEAYWHYDEDRGFILNPGANLIDALVSATQPEATGKLYDFSCYRASEYVILLGLARELQQHNPELFDELQTYNQYHAIRSGQFHDVFLIEYGLEQALPVRYYVPGDRLWFRNPDAHSSDASGFEGSWVIYMGGGLFSNFWRRDDPFTLESKCVEVFHWRHGTYTDAEGELRIDEERVTAHCRDTFADPEKTQSVLQRMIRLRDPKGVYADGGCIDSTREYPRAATGHGCELSLPQLPEHLRAITPAIAKSSRR
jgi:hypothetical protein